MIIIIIIILLLLFIFIFTQRRYIYANNVLYLCFVLITRPEKSYRVWFVWVWSWSLDKEEALAHQGLLDRRIKWRLCLYVQFFVWTFFH